MIAPKFVDLYARNAGLRDKLVAERDVVLTYALRALLDEGVMDHLAFKGGTCLRTMVFGSSGRFSEDLDFTIASELSEDDVLVRLTASPSLSASTTRPRTTPPSAATSSTATTGTTAGAFGFR
ncbi:MAG: nucleotidyl transferase AbiEii/AbiGii toxin family protein [Gemmatimonadota bacterium]